MTIIRDVNGATGTALTLAGKSHKQLQKEVITLAEKLWQVEKAAKDNQERMRQKSTRINHVLISLRRRLRDQDETIMRMGAERDRLMRDVASSLLLVEGKLRREQKDILRQLESKDRVIEEQKKEIRALKIQLAKVSHDHLNLSVQEQKFSRVCPARDPGQHHLPAVSIQGLNFPHVHTVQRPSHLELSGGFVQAPNHPAGSSRFCQQDNPSASVQGQNLCQVYPCQQDFTPSSGICVNSYKSQDNSYAGESIGTEPSQQKTKEECTRLDNLVSSQLQDTNDLLADWSPTRTTSRSEVDRMEPQALSSDSWVIHAETNSYHSSSTLEDRETAKVTHDLEALNLRRECEQNGDLWLTGACSMPPMLSPTLPTQEDQIQSLPPDLVGNWNESDQPTLAEQQAPSSLPPVVIPVRRWQSACCPPSAKIVPVRRQSSVSFTSDGHVRPAGSLQSLDTSFVTSFETPVPHPATDMVDDRNSTKISIRVPHARFQRSISLNSDGDETNLDSLSSGASDCWTAEDEDASAEHDAGRADQPEVANETVAGDLSRIAPQKSVRYFGNHRSVIKPRDIKYKRVIRLQGRNTVESQENLRYWTEPFL